MAREVPVIVVLALIACGTKEPEGTPPEPTWAVSGVAQVVPSSGLPAEVSPNHANNNLDVASFDGRWYLAFRTADTHFAGPEVRMVVMSTTDEQSWRYEGEVALGTDVREPQLVPIDGVLWLYFTRLGDSSLDFEPGGVERTQVVGPDAWAPPVPVFEDGFLAWRIKWLDGRLVAFGYAGGENIYDGDGEPIDVQWLTSDDGATWRPAYGDDPTVITGGASESDGVFLDDGRFVAVARNEAGWPEDGFGSYICTAPASDPMAWDCVTDARKFDSPFMFVEAGRPWLIARRNVTETGAYDLGLTDLAFADQYGSYQLDYWLHPKRCSLWSVDPDTRAVDWVLDLPSNGDTCFADGEKIDGSWRIYNYSNDPEGEELSWYEGQYGDTNVYRMELTFGP